MRSIDPTTGESFAEFQEHTPKEVCELLAHAEEIAPAWRGTPFEERARLMRRAGMILREKRSGHAALMTREMGKPITQAEAEVDKCAAACDFFADHAARFLADEPVKTDASRSYIRYEPLGAILAIMPWNFPFWQVFRFAAPNLMAGNVGILKHAPNVSGCSLAIEHVFHDAGFPVGTFTSLLVDASAVEGLINESVVKGVTLTGSGRAGAAVGAQAGRALKKSVLELGGSDPFIVLPDADPVATARAAVAARCVNSGQSCIAAKRFIVVGDNPRFENEFSRAMAALRVGDPRDRQTEIGPLARRDLLENLARQVSASLDAGARLLTRGQILPGKGFFYAPTLLAEVRPGMPAFDEETFGPVAAMIRASDIDEAVCLANQTVYGLGASVWTGDSAVAERLAGRLECGTVFINGMVKSDPRLPFGGIKQSGYGRELASIGIREFTNVKTVWVKDVIEPATNASTE